MPKPRLRLRTMLILVALAALAAAGVRWQGDRERRAVLLRRAERCEKFAAALRRVPMMIDRYGGVTAIRLGVNFISYSMPTDSARTGLTKAEAEAKLAGPVAEYERLARAYRRAARYPWASPPEPGPIPTFFYSASRSPTLQGGVPLPKAKTGRTPSSNGVPRAK